jgi:hypothetical protein
MRSKQPLAERGGKKNRRVKLDKNQTPHGIARGTDLKRQQKNMHKQDGKK